MQSSMGGRVIDCTHVTLGHVVLDNATQLRSGEDPELQNTLKNASYRGGQAAN